MCLLERDREREKETEGVDYPLFTAFHKAQFQKNLSNTFGKKIYVLTLGPKMTHFPYFGQNKNFPRESRTFTFTQFLMPLTNII